MFRKKVETSQYGTIIVNGYALNTIDESTLENWAGDLTYVSYYTYGFNMNGTLIPINDEILIASAYNNQVAPLMVITPLNNLGEYSYDLVHTVLNSPILKDFFIDNIVNTVIDKEYYGVVFNFGYILKEDREDFVVLVSKTARRLNRKRALVLVSLLPKTTEEQPMLRGIDYQSLALGANLIEILTYDLNQYLNQPRAVAPYNLIRETLDFAITKVNPNNMLLGVLNYGYDWTLPFIEGESVAEIIPNVEALERAKRVGAEVQLDELTQSPFYKYIDDQGLEHIVWFENELSMRAKLELVNEYGLAGISIWTIMNPFPSGLKVLNELYTVFKIDLD